jgi:chromosome segregation ATPase
MSELDRLQEAADRVIDKLERELAEALGDRANLYKACEQLRRARDAARTDSATLEATVERKNAEIAASEKMAMDYKESCVNLHTQRKQLAEALRDLLMVIETDQLIPESVSYMKQAHAALKAAGMEE